MATHGIMNDDSLNGVVSAIPMSRSPNFAALRRTGGAYHSLEHWRGFAALWVMIFHAVGTQEGHLHPMVEWLKVPARFGWLGVHLFFVISGYCIAANVQSLRAEGLGAFVFLRDRLYRILPVYWAAFGASILLAAVVGRFNHTTATDNFPIGGRAWLGNLLLIQPYLGTKCYVIVYWTLVIELGFYFLVALLYALARASIHLATGLALTLALIAIWIPPWPRLLVLACWPEFICGALVFYALRAGHRQEHTRRNLCLGGIVFLGVVGGMVAHGAEPALNSPKQLAFGAAYALVLYALYPFDDAIRKARTLRWLSRCGLFSFSLYLIHCPVGIRVYGIGLRFFPLQSPFYALLVIGFCLVSVGASYLFYQVFEARFQRWRQRFKAFQYGNLHATRP